MTKNLRETAAAFDSPSNPEAAVYYDGMPRFVTERDMADADRARIERDDEAAVEYAHDLAIHLAECERMRKGWF